MNRILEGEVVVEPLASFDDDDESVDPDAHLKTIGKQSSIHRNNSYESFLTRSQRNQELGKDKPPSKEEASKRRVRFNDTLEIVHDVERVDESEYPRVFMTHEDFGRMQAETKLALFRWENHLAGKIKFDEDNNTLRGLESYDYETQSSVDLARYHHRQRVLEEIRKQTMKRGHVTNWEKVRHISEQLSMRSSISAREMGKMDEHAFHKAWAIPEAVEPDEPKKKEKKKGIFQSWRKRGSSDG